MNIKLFALLSAVTLMGTALQAHPGATASLVNRSGYRIQITPIVEPTQNPTFQMSLRDISGQGRPGRQYLYNTALNALSKWDGSMLVPSGYALELTSGHKTGEVVIPFRLEGARRDGFGTFVATVKFTNDKNGAEPVVSLDLAPQDGSLPIQAEALEGVRATLALVDHPDGTIDPGQRDPDAGWLDDASSSSSPSLAQPCCTIL